MKKATEVNIPKSSEKMINVAIDLSSKSGLLFSLYTLMR